MQPWSLQKDATDATIARVEMTIIFLRCMQDRNTHICMKVHGILVRASVSHLVQHCFFPKCSDWQVFNTLQ